MKIFTVFMDCFGRFAPSQRRKEGISLTSSLRDKPKRLGVAIHFHNSAELTESFKDSAESPSVFPISGLSLWIASGVALAMTIKVALYPQLIYTCKSTLLSYIA